MKKSLALLGAAVALGSLAPQAQAFDWFGGRLSIGGGYGRVKPKLPYDYQNKFQDGEAWSGHIQYFMNNDISILASYADLEPYARGNKADQYRFRPVVGSLRYNIFHHLPFTPYITAGAGYSDNKHEAPGAQTVKWGGFTYQAGAGLEFFITEGTSLGAEALYHHFTGNTGDTNSPFRLVSLMGTMNIHFGAGPSARRTEEALQKEKADADAAQAALAAQQAATAAAQQQTTAAQQQALTAQQQQAQAAAAAAAAAAAQNADAEKRNQELQAQMAQAQAEMDAIKDMVAHKNLAPVTFKTGSAELLVASNAALDKVAETAKKYPNLKLRVEGHTDSVGGEETNMKLSQRRADSVKNYLTTTGNVPADQITAVGFGKTRPIASNDTAEGRAQNRRVEFIFFLK